MGTSEFGIPTLRELLNLEDHQVVAIYTKEPAISGRGNKINISPIHEIANHHNLQVFTPRSLRDTANQKTFQELAPDVAIVVSYGLILPQEILNIPQYGCFNIHPSKLPLYRGSAPLQRSIMDGEKESAVCIIKMDNGIDSGDIVYSQEFTIEANDDYQSIAIKTAEIGAKLMIKTLKNIESLELAKQNHQLASYAKKIDKAECLIDWNQPAIKIFNHIRGLSGNLGAYFYYQGEKIKILQSTYSMSNQDLDIKNFPNGSVINDKFYIKCDDGIIIPKILQKQGKNPLKINEFLNGFKPQIGSICS